MTKPERISTVPTVFLGLPSSRAQTAEATVPGAAFGKAHLETGRAREVGEPFRSASISKIFTATAILQLADEGKLTLEDKSQSTELFLLLSKALFPEKVS